MTSPDFKLIQTERYTFEKKSSYHHPQKVYNVVPGDFTQDGMLDILLMTQDRTPNQLALQMYIGIPGGGFGVLLILLICIFVF
jgi:integrin alpha FG-GAP repeat containing protein 1